MPDTTGWFSFGGVSSADMMNELIIHKVPDLNRSAQKIDVFSVPGRDGDIILPQNAWENQEQIYECYVGKGDAAAAASELAAWLFSMNGYQELKDGWETDVFRMAYLSAPLEIENIMGKVGHVEITFSCVPKRFLVSGQTAITKTATGTITNPTVFTAKPLLKVTNSGVINGTLACGGNTLGISANVTQMYIDCETCQAYSIDGTAFYNNMVTGQFPVIPSGTQTFSITGGISSVEITPRWYRR